MSDKLRTLVTGSSGFIGKALCAHLSGLGHHVVGLDIVPPASDEGLDVFIQCDLLDAEALAAAVRSSRCSGLVHLAAVTGLLEDVAPSHYDANTLGVQNLVDAVAASGCVERAVYTSSQLVCQVGHVPSSDTEYRPNTKYGASKVETERIVRASDGGGCTWCLTRPTSIWGPGMGDHHLRFFRLLRRGLYVHFGRDERQKSYGYIGNTVHQLAQLLDGLGPGTHRKVFYIADYELLGLRRWLDGIQAGIGGPKIRTVPLFLGVVAARVGDALGALGVPGVPLTSFRLNNIRTEYQFDMGHTEAACGALPFDIARGIEETGRWLNEAFDQGTGS